MAKKQTIYTVSKDTNEVIRTSKTVLSAFEFSATLPVESFYICTSEFGNLKKGQPISNIASFL